ncbi:hypothetical protein HU200_020994 [Digitaria exilis]|uniref:Uncharacterized protein n=1 Tax=Digitaria exilis TaxID=1010633 RepID=A0A835EZR6_9POAL|nr:hypothetical protein HU200_020994 [Digitaria exilis]CAB3472567.1 unnamed protein product [Digitaria exilis]
MADGKELLARSSAAAAAVLRMNSSRQGKTSYTNNSDVQRAIASVTKKARQDMAAALYRALGHPASMAIADLGCATGPNALLLVSDAVEAVLAEKSKAEEEEPQHQLQLLVFLNDLPGNDFNAVFRLLPSSPLAAGNGCLVSAWPGSFYGRIFPDASLDYVVASSSLHFLSKAPAMKVTNRGRVYVSVGSPAAVKDAYRAQFEADFSTFLGCRAAEMRPRGLLLLTFVARRTAAATAHDCYLWDVLADALMAMAAAGLVDEEQVHGFNVPFYAACPDELVEVVSNEGSFTVVGDAMELFESTRLLLASSQHPTEEEDDEEEELPRWLAVETVSTIRAVLEPMLQAHFGPAAMDELFSRYRILLEAYYRDKASINKDDITNVFLVLEKKHH